MLLLRRVLFDPVFMWLRGSLAPAAGRTAPPRRGAFAASLRYSHLAPQHQLAAVQKLCDTVATQEIATDSSVDQGLAQRGLVVNSIYWFLTSTARSRDGEIGRRSGLKTLFRI